MTRLFGIAGRSGQGKTTLIEAMLPWFTARGLTVNVVKHSHHPVELEPPRKDSARFRAAGAGEVLIASPARYAIVRELRDAAEPSLDALIARLSPADLTLVEGFTQVDMPRLEVVRPSTGGQPLCLTQSSIIAVASDSPYEATACNLPLNDPARVAEFICRMLGVNTDTHQTADNRVILS
ncbi:molybdopterin-guanine dinucleotide biosynthesis protein B [Paraburkholderia sp. Tr-20389]|uniref:molybdopterin-guanine dinucleotide biosynthesis protein B n=1 Tax=Paraburkholderia sp. Tr-20389 TaxID=2703903 RepID=UPI0019806918|nr:molybdopterin-guanine dinucleotide biosynthesis protein B [Paraburkholderia sp. Tr-20389]MBN3757720.1 molybdopterin-guanine dinucleotide biosynthesis protein B [Paraburkholderia sp. Tr-20389]